MFRTLQQVNTAILPHWQLCLAVLALLLLDGDGQHHGPDHLLHQHHLQVVQGQGAGVGDQEIFVNTCVMRNNCGAIFKS